MWFVQRDEETCRKRCLEIQEVLVESMPFQKKFGTIFTLMDTYTDEDSDVNLLKGVKIPTNGPVYLSASAAGDKDTKARLDADIPFQGLRDLPDQVLSSATATSSTSASSSPAPEKRTAVVLTAEQEETIAKNKKAAQEKKALLAAAAHQIKELEIFHAQQWIP